MSVKVGIELVGLSPDFFKKQADKAVSEFGRITKASREADQQITASHSQRRQKTELNEGAMAAVRIGALNRTLEEEKKYNALRLKYFDDSGKGISADLKKLQEQKVFEINAGIEALKAGRIAEAQVHAATKRDLDEEIRLMNQLLRTKEGVLHHGEGAQNGFLGIGREIIGEFGGGAGFGGVAGKALGVGAVGALAFGFKEAVAEGLKEAQINSGIESGFLNNGVAADKLAESMKRVNAYTEEWAPKLVTTELHFKELVRDATQLGGFTGEAALQVAKMAAAVEKATGGEVSGQLFTRALAKGFADPDSINLLGRLTQTYPALAAAVRGSKDQYEIFNKVVEFTNTLVQQQEKYAKSNAGSIEEMANRGKDAWAKLGEGALVSTAFVAEGLRGIKHTAEDVANFPVYLNEQLHILTGNTNLAERAKYGLLTASDKVKVKAQEEAHAVDLQSQALNNEKAASEAATFQMEKEAAKIGVLASQYERIKGILDDFDTKRSKLEFLKNEATVLQQKLDRGDLYNFGRFGGSSNKQLLDDDIKQIRTLGGELDGFNKTHKKIEIFDPSVDHGEGGKDPNKTAFEKRKAQLEDAMAAEQAAAEAFGRQQNNSKQAIEIDRLNIQIKYDLLIAEAGKNNAQLHSQYIRSAEDAQEKIRQIGLENLKKSLENAHKIYEQEFSRQEKTQHAHDEFVMASTKDTYDKQHLSLYAKLQKDLEDTELSDEAILDIIRAYNIAYDAIEKERNDKSQLSRIEAEKRLLDIQKKGIEDRIKYLEDDTALQLSLEYDLYRKEDELRQENYKKNIIDAQGDEERINIANEQNNVEIEDKWQQHLERFKKITANANKDIVAIFKNSAGNVLSTWQTDLFKPLDDEITRTKNPLLSFFRDIGKGFADLGKDKITKAFGKLFESKESPGEKLSSTTQTIATAAIHIDVGTLSIKDISLGDFPQKVKDSLQTTTGALPPDFDQNFNTVLKSDQEAEFQKWKAKNVPPTDTGIDYDYRGAFKKGLNRDLEKEEHFPDEFKKPNHPTFSDESKYANYGKPGHWDGDKFLPPLDVEIKNSEPFHEDILSRLRNGEETGIGQEEIVTGLGGHGFEPQLPFDYGKSTKQRRGSFAPPNIGGLGNSFIDTNGIAYGVHPDSEGSITGSVKSIEENTRIRAREAQQEARRREKERGANLRAAQEEEGSNPVLYAAGAAFGKNPSLGGGVGAGFIETQTDAAVGTYNLLKKYLEMGTGHSPLPDINEGYDKSKNSFFRGVNDNTGRVIGNVVGYGTSAIGMEGLGVPGKVAANILSTKSIDEGLNKIQSGNIGGGLLDATLPTILGSGFDKLHSSVHAFVHNIESEAIQLSAPLVLPFAEKSVHFGIDAIAKTMEEGGGEKYSEENSNKVSESPGLKDNFLFHQQFIDNQKILSNNTKTTSDNFKGLSQEVENLKDKMKSLGDTQSPGYNPNIDSGIPINKNAYSSAIGPTLDGSAMGTTANDDGNSQQIGISIGQTLLSTINNSKQQKPADVLKSGFASMASLALNSIIPGLGGLAGPLFSLLGLSDGAAIQRPNYYATGTHMVDFKKMGTDTVPAMLTPGEVVYTAQEHKTINRAFARMAIGQPANGNSGGGGGGEVIQELQGLRSDIKNLNIFISSTRQMQLGMVQDTLRHSTSKY